MEPDERAPNRLRRDDFLPDRSLPSSTGVKPSRGASALAILLALGFGFCCLLGLIFLSASLAPVVIAAVAFAFLLFGGAAVHYLIWGWWLGDMIREDVAAEEREEAERRKA